MLGQHLRKKTQRIFKDIGRFISKTGIPPNAMTLIAILFAAISAYFIIQQKNFLALIFVILTGLWDLFDGAVARAQNKATKFGNYLDAMTDRFVEIIIYFGFAFIGYGVGRRMRCHRRKNKEFKNG